VLAAEGEAKLADDFQVELVQIAFALEGGHEAPYVFAEIHVVVVHFAKCNLFEHLALTLTHQQCGGTGKQQDRLGLRS